MLNISCNQQKVKDKEAKIIAVLQDTIDYKIDDLQKKYFTFFKVFFNVRSYTGFNQYIDSEYGVTILFSIGIPPNFVRLDSFSKKKDYIKKDIPSWIVDKLCKPTNYPKVFKLELMNAPVFECEHVLKYGIYIDTSNSNIISQSINEQLKTEADYFSPEFIKSQKVKLSFYKKIEKQSFKVIVTSRDRNIDKIEIFYFTEKNGKLFLYLIDYYSTDCSV